MSRKQSKSETGERRGVSVAQAWCCVGFFFAAVTLLNSSAMHRSASLLEYGPARSFWMAVLQPLDCASRMSGGNRLRAWAETGLGERLNAETKQ